MNGTKVLALTLALTKSQLRASRSGGAPRSFFRRPAIILIIDAAGFIATLVLGYFVASALAALSGNLEFQTSTAVREAMVFVPALVPSIVLIAGLLFELNVSSKFSASDTVNWLPITQTEYVLASALSVAYNYSITPSIVLGATLGPAIVFGYSGVWVLMAGLSMVTLFTGATLVEILRAALNRVGSVVMKRARRGALALRLVLLIGVVLIVQILFNFDFLLGIMSAFSKELTTTAFIPIFWGSLAVTGLAMGNLVWAVGFSFSTVAFCTAMVWVAARVRSRYWAPIPVSVTITSSEYTPTRSPLLRLGLSPSEVAIVRKDLKGITRRRELLTYFAIPVVFAAIFLLENFTARGSGGGNAGFALDFPGWFVGGLFGLMISSISFGQESRAVMVLYSLPLAPRELLRAKAFVALVFSLTAAVVATVIFSVINAASTLDLLENLAVSVSIVVEEVAIGLAIGASHPDFQERPRPRFVDPVWLMVMVVIGFPVLFITGTPIILRDLGAALPEVNSAFWYVFPSAIVFAVAVSIGFFRWAGRSVARLMSEYGV